MHDIDRTQMEFESGSGVFETEYEGEEAGQAKTC